MSLADKLKGLELPPTIKWKVRPEILTLPNIPMPMSGVAPRVVLGQEWWDATRKAAYRSTNFHCITCGIIQYEAKEHQWLEAHEVYSIDYIKGHMVYLESVPLCHYCHNFIHDGRLKALLVRKEITAAKYNKIMKHGRKILRLAKLKKPEPYLGSCATWESWRMVLDGVEYPPLYPSYAEWKEKFNPTS